MPEEREPLSSEEMIRRARRGLGSQADQPAAEDEPVTTARQRPSTPLPSPARRIRPTRARRAARRAQGQPQAPARPPARAVLAIAIAVALMVMGIVAALLFGSAAG